MKLLTGDEKKKAFVPFDLFLRVETEDEARLLWHCFNRGELWEAITKEEFYCGEDYIEPQRKDLSGSREIIRDFIETKVQIRKDQKGDET